eukprot:257493-Chlamydomonas_euryale.AAC.5
MRRGILSVEAAIRSWTAAVKRRQGGWTGRNATRGAHGRETRELAPRSIMEAIFRTRKVPACAWRATTETQPRGAALGCVEVWGRHPVKPVRRDPNAPKHDEPHTTDSSGTSQRVSEAERQDKARHCRAIPTATDIKDSQQRLRVISGCGCNSFVRASNCKNGSTTKRGHVQTQQQSLLTGVCAHCTCPEPTHFQPCPRQRL